MHNENLWAQSLTKLKEILSSGDVTALGVVDSFLTRIKCVGNKVGAWAALDLEGVREEAAALDRKKSEGGGVGAMFGIPLGLKDIINTKGLPTRMGSPIWKDHHAGNDARVVAHLLWEDALVLGKTVTAEFAVHSPNGTKNPHCLTCTPGTSSSGSAAAVASGMAPAALGTQTAGSLIRPASFCGVYGYKPTFGWIPRTGILKTTDTLDQVGFHARDAHDLRLLFETTRVKGRNYYLKEKRLAENPAKKKWRVGVVASHVSEYAPDYAHIALDAFGKSIESSCIEVVKLSLPEKFSKSHSIHERIYDSDLAYYFRKEYKKHPELISDSLIEIIEHGLALSPEDYRVALAEQVDLQGQLDALFTERKLDVLLTLSSNGEAPQGEEPIPWMDSCLIWTMCGVPSASVPVFKGPNGMPYGAQFVSRKYGDHVLLGLIEHLREENVIEASQIAGLKENLGSMR